MPDSSAMTALGDRVATTIQVARRGGASSLHLYGPRGSGKSWWLDEAARHASDCDMTVARARGNADDMELPFGALSTLMTPLRDRLEETAFESLRAVLSFEPVHADSFDVKLSVFKLLCAAAAERPLCLVLDDLHLFDAASLEVLAFAMRRADADAIACISASPQPSPATSSQSARLEATPTQTLSSMLVARGLTHGAAQRCADAADGSPGIAVALADGLSEAQRAGSAPIAVLPRPSGGLVDDLQARLRSYGEPVCRALVMAAAEHGGDTAAVRGALTALGEDADGFDIAESLGLVDIVGARFVFTDPWIRTVAYHLVAPNSRRAAHNALAAWFAAPEQAASRVWHLAAAASGASESVADALSLVAADTARRGGLASAALTAERAAEFSESPTGRQRHQLAALQWWMDASSAEGVRRLIGAVEPLDADAAVARAEAVEFLDGGGSGVAWDGPQLDGPWMRRRQRRMAIDTAVQCGDHRGALRALDDNRGRGDLGASDLVAMALSLRHSGRLREARDAAIRASAMLDGSDVFPMWMSLLIGVDLDVLQGRNDDAIATLRSVRHKLPAQLDEWAFVLGARALLQSDVTTRPADQAIAFAPSGTGALFDIRESVRRGALEGDETALRTAIELADKHSLPIEAGEARLWLASTQSSPSRHDTLVLCRATLQRCGVRGWDHRLAALSAGEQEVAPTRVADRAIDALSQAEFRVAEAIAAGLTNREASAKLLISVKTVDFHLQQMYRKLGIRSRTELAVRMTNFEPTPNTTTATGGRR